MHRQRRRRMRLIREMTDKDKVQGIHDYLKGTKVNEAGLKNLAPYFIGELRELTDFSHYVTRCIETLEGAFTFQYTQCFFVGASASSAHLDVVFSIFARMSSLAFACTGVARVARTSGISDSPFRVARTFRRRLGSEGGRRA